LRLRVLCVFAFNQKALALNYQTQRRKGRKDAKLPSYFLHVTEREKLVNIYYNDEKLDKYFKADFLCYGKIIVELKAVSFIHQDNINQTRNYLKSTKLQLGLWWCCKKYTILID